MSKRKTYTTVLKSGGFITTHSSLKSACEASGLDYKKLSRKKMPFTHQDIDFFKVENNISFHDMLVKVSLDSGELFCGYNFDKISDYDQIEEVFILHNEYGIEYEIEVNIDTFSEGEYELEIGVVRTFEGVEVDLSNETMSLLLFEINEYIQQ